ncbi:MAG: dihydrofolate reductase, partial [Anaerolineae bacterium]|nr:dihydrofolate reductase [Anaerolineae bacterium]
MAKVILSMNISLDGFFEGPHHELDWSIADEYLHDFYADLLSHADLIVFGRVTYNMMASYWPTASNDPNISSGERHFAEALNPMAKIVYSTTLTKVDWNTRLMRQFLPEEFMKIKASTKGVILLGGGASLVQPFIENHLVDEIQLVVHPVEIGAGKPFFQDLDHVVNLHLQWIKPFPSGAVALSYR